MNESKSKGMYGHMNASATVRKSVVHNVDIVLDPIQGMSSTDEVVITLNGRVIKRMYASQASSLFNLDATSSEFDATVY